MVVQDKVSHLNAEKGRESTSMSISKIALLLISKNLPTGEDKPKYYILIYLAPTRLISVVLKISIPGSSFNNNNIVLLLNSKVSLRIPLRTGAWRGERGGRLLRNISGQV